MATYAIGDIQGCFGTLSALLARLPFDPARDRLWLAGDLVNRGPDSLGVLRWARSLGPAVTAVLGNHDLHLLRVAAGLAPHRGKDSLTPILQAPDRDALLDWLAARPLIHREVLDGQPWLMVHAGLHPTWSADAAEALARQAVAALTADRRAFLAALDGPGELAWSPELSGDVRFAALVGVLTRLRCCRDDGSPCADHKGTPDSAPPGCRPWYEVAPRAWSDHRVVCGHWAALGVHVGDGVAALDSGCVWGRELTALRLEDGALFSEPAVE